MILKQMNSKLYKHYGAGILPRRKGLITKSTNYPIEQISLKLRYARCQVFEGLE